MALVLSILFSVLSVEASVSDQSKCQPRDLRSHFGKARNQSNAAWCCAFAVADLISFKLGIKVSAADLALEYSQYRGNLGEGRPPSRATHTGCEYPQYLLDLAREKGVCAEDKFPSQELGTAGLREYFKDLEDRQADFNKILGKPESTGSWFQLPFFWRSKPAGEDAKVCKENGLLPPGPPSSLRLLEELKLRLDASSWNLLLKMRDQKCGKRISIKHLGESENLPVLSDLGPIPGDFIGQLQTQMDGNNPVVIGYDSKVSHTGENWFLSWLHTQTLGYQRGLHAALVVGRRWSETTKTCQFLIRSSWGGKCGDAVDCEPDGSLWVPEPILSTFTSSVSYFK